MPLRERWTDIEQMEEAFEGKEFLYNWCQDFELALDEAGRTGLFHRIMPGRYASTVSGWRETLRKTGRCCRRG